MGLHNQMATAVVEPMTKEPGRFISEALVEGLFFFRQRGQSPQAPNFTDYSAALSTIETSSLNHLKYGV